MSLELELKRLKENKEAPEWLTLEGFSTLSGSYLLPNETPVGMYKRLAQTAAKLLKRNDLEQQFFDILFKGWLCPATPVASNFGTTRGLSISCFSMSAPDSIDGIFKSNHELAMLSKNGGGVAVCMSNVRGRNSNISGNGKSEGIVPWIKCMDSTTVAVSQGSVRRGASAFYLNVDHPDFEEFLRIRRPSGDVNRQCLNIHHGAVLTDEFMKKVEAGDSKAREVWIEILKTRFETGEPYLMFTDTVNNNNPSCYKDKNFKVETSNLCCLTGDEKVVTSNGNIPISELVGKTVSIFDGINWVSNNSFRNYGVPVGLYKVTFKSGRFMRVSDNHRFPLINGDVVLATELKGGEVVKSNGFSKTDNEVVRIEYIPVNNEAVYCTTVPSTSFFALENGTLTGNSEITLKTDENHTFVCCLSSLNLTRYDEWKDTNLVELSIYFLDAVMEDFINKAANIPGLERAINFATKSRALGLGVLGWHSLLQSKMIAFDSLRATNLNKIIFKQIKEQSDQATAKLAKEYGEPEWCKGHGVRNSHRLAIAPTVSNSTISGNVSAGIEPLAGNAFTKKGAKGTFAQKNPYLVPVLKKYNKDNDETWKSITISEGSVQQLDFLTDKEKDVFLTAREINQLAIIKQAADRQKYIDQSQSVNLFFPVNTDPKHFHKIHMEAWKQGLKTLYYVRTGSVLKGDVASRFTSDECKSCEG